MAAFRATLEETVRADLLLHVVDSASPVRLREAEDVGKVLAEIEADAIPQLAVWNKLELPDCAARSPKRRSCESSPAIPKNHLQN